MPDESQRTREQEALRASEERFRLATEVASEAIWEWNLADDCVIWSPAYAGMFGQSIEAGGTGRWWYEHLHRTTMTALPPGFGRLSRGTQ